MIELGRNVVSEIIPPPKSWREKILNNPATSESFHEALESQSVLSQVEMKNYSTLSSCDVPELNVLFWNVERCKFVPEIAERLISFSPDIVLLAELDKGMVRSGNRHTTRELAEALKMNYIFAVEFLELDLGDKRERTWHKGEHNSEGLHGGAILSRFPLYDPAVMRLELDGRWFDGELGERRVGGRIAVVAKIKTRNGPVTLVSVHYESHDTPEQRAEQTQVMCEQLLEYAADTPWVIGGDFNTNTFPRTTAVSIPREVKLASLEKDPDRLKNPIPYEPMFPMAKEYGLEWEACNAPGTTQRTRPDGTPAPPFVKLDWFFTKSAKASGPEILAAVDSEGNPISDHEILKLQIQL
ncbi:MAG: endonuclease/exonuclease/phosphatase family protein [SAR324 cluster bacterium]|nr:endonuclease/exonuclease/phosphatase family protein [SAR324 cluster bacterium]